MKVKFLYDSSMMKEHDPRIEELCYSDTDGEVLVTLTVSNDHTGEDIAFALEEVKQILKKIKSIKAL
jgi:hypothetical protein